MKKEVWINLGSGVHLIKDFINVDNFFDYDDLLKRKGVWCNAKIEEGAEFVRADMRKLPFPNNYADYMLSHYSIEHLPMGDIIPTLREWKRVLKPTGELYIATLDFDALMELWQGLCSTSNADWRMGEFIEVAQMIYGNQITDGEYHYCPFNLKSMNHMMALGGFPYWETQIFPAYAFAPKIKGYPDPEVPSVIKCGELHVRARKTTPKQKGKRK
jgi:SAM-dependent methyltransferase